MWQQREVREAELEKKQEQLSRCSAKVAVRAINI